MNIGLSTEPTTAKYDVHRYLLMVIVDVRTGVFRHGLLIGEVLTDTRSTYHSQARRLTQRKPQLEHHHPVAQGIDQEKCAHASSGSISISTPVLPPPGRSRSSKNDFHDVFQVSYQKRCQQLVTFARRTMRSHRYSRLKRKKLL